MSVYSLELQAAVCFLCRAMTICKHFLKYAKAWMAYIGITQASKQKSKNPGETLKDQLICICMEFICKNKLECQVPSDEICNSHKDKGGPTS